MRIRGFLRELPLLVVLLALMLTVNASKVDVEVDVSIQYGNKGMFSMLALMVLVSAAGTHWRAGEQRRGRIRAVA